MVVLCGALLGPLNSTMIAVALPPMATSLEVDTASMGWLVTAYLIAMAALQPVAGRIGDRWGPRGVLLTGHALFLVASVLAVLVTSLPLLVACRVAQAAAGAMLTPTGLALLRRTAPEDQLGRTFGLFGAVVPLGAAVGPVLGGLLIEVGGWEAIFLVNVPITTFALLLGWRAIPALPSRDQKTSGPFDLLGAVWLCALLVALTTVLEAEPRGSVLLLSVIALALMSWAFLRYESRRKDPVLPPGVFAHRSFAVAAGGLALSNFAFYITLLAVPLLLHARGVEGAAAGIILGALTLASSPLSVLGGKLVDHLGLRPPAVGGLALVTLGLIPLVLQPTALPLPLLVGSLIVMGAGVGLSMPAFQVGALHDIGEEDTGVATGVLFTSRYLGSMIGTSLLAGPLAPDSSDAATLLFTVLVGAAALGAAVSGALPRGRTRPSART